MYKKPNEISVTEVLIRSLVWSKPNEWRLTLLLMRATRPSARSKNTAINHEQRKYLALRLLMSERLERATNSKDRKVIVFGETRL